MLEVNDIDVYYGRQQALWGVSLHVNEGEIVALVGANAAGKSTLLNTISGLIRPKSGSVNFLGRTISSLPAHKTAEAGICQIREGRRLFPDMTVEENLELGAYMRRVWSERAATAEEMYELFPRLQERRKQAARTLSGGEQQMLAIARGLMSKPKLCMFDEPSHGLAPQLVAEVFDICKILRDRGCTVFLVEQDVEHSLEISDRAYVMENGRIALEGTGQELLQSELVRAAYLGL